jgi:hypothetical protein
MLCTMYNHTKILLNIIIEVEITLRKLIFINVLIVHSEKLEKITVHLCYSANPITYVSGQTFSNITVATSVGQ